MTGLSANPDARLWTHQPRHCHSPEGRLLTWYASAVDGGVRRQVYRLGNRPLTDDEGEQIREQWGDTRLNRRRRRYRPLRQGGGRLRVRPILLSPRNRPPCSGRRLHGQLAAVGEAGVGRLEGPRTAQPSARIRWRARWRSDANTGSTGCCGFGVRMGTGEPPRPGEFVEVIPVATVIEVHPVIRPARAFVTRTPIVPVYRRSVGPPVAACSIRPATDRRRGRDASSGAGQRTESTSHYGST